MTPTSMADIRKPGARGVPSQLNKKRHHTRDSLGIDNQIQLTESGSEVSGAQISACQSRPLGALCHLNNVVSR